MKVKLQQLNYNSSKSITDSAYLAIVERIGKDRADKLFNTYVNGQIVNVGEDGFPVQWFDMISDESIKEYLEIDELEFRFANNHILYDAIIRLRLYQVAYAL